RMKKLLNLDIVPAPKGDAPIQLAHPEAAVPRIGMTKNLRMQVNGRSIMHACEVMKLAQGIELIIGTDTLHRFGVGLAGLEGFDKVTARTLPTPVEDERAPLGPLTPTPIEQSE
ncbi:hypothetical protein BGW38_009889, partial [Lunasporangiospora selenospora]